MLDEKRRPMSVYGAVTALCFYFCALAASAQGDFDPGSIVLNTSQELPTFLTFSAIDLDAALCPVDLDSRNDFLDNSILGHGSMGEKSLPRTDPEAIRVYLDQQEKPHGGGDDPISNISQLRKRVGSDGDTCGGPMDLSSEILKLCLESIDIVTTSCGEWRLVVSLDPLLPQPVQYWNVFDTGNGGIFVTDVTLALMLTFTHQLDNREVILRRTLVVRGAGNWSRQAGPGGFESDGDFEIDTDCDCINDFVAAESAQFHPGWEVPPGPPGLARQQQITPSPYCLHDPEGGGQFCFEPVLLEEGKFE